MRNAIEPLSAGQRISLDGGQTVRSPPSFEEVIHDVGVTILPYLIMALTAELLTRGVALG